MKNLYGRNCEENFDYLKRELGEARILHHPDFNKPFVITTDASNKE